MLRALPFFCALAQLLLPVAASAQERSVGDDLEHVIEDGWAVLSAPADATSEDMRTAALFLGGAGVLVLADGTVQDWVRAHPGSPLVRALGPFRLGGPLDRLGTTPVIASLAGIALLSGVAFDHDGLRDAGAGCIATSAASIAVRQVVMMTLPRARPSEARGPFGFEPPGLRGWSMGSLPSGHAANPAACYAALAERFDLGVAEPILWTIPIALGLARVPDEAHWLSDTYLGIGLGYAIGRAIGGRVVERAAPSGPQPALSVVARVRF